MPAPFLKIANTGFLSAASASLSPNAAGSPRRDRKRRSDKYKRELEKENKDASRNDSKTEDPSRPPHLRRESIMLMDQQDMPDGSALEYAKSTRDLRSAYGNGETKTMTAAFNDQSLSHRRMLSIEEEDERREIYDSRLTLAIWALATTNANPAIDLLVCLERQRDIGFMYKDITRSVVIHHGSKDTRVPVENVKWLGRTMRKCEVRVLEGEGHGLMASAAVMGGVLEEMGREFRDWDELVRKGANVRRY
jgi:pimeloyl-ACP methyl ester carboxylesterase